MKLVKTIGLTLVSAGVIALGAPAANAAIIDLGTSLFTVQNADLGGGTGNFGSVQVTLNNTTGVATFTFTAGPGREFGDGNVADLNLNTSSFGSVTFISATPGLAANQAF